jgi:hypothetical protein
MYLDTRGLVALWREGLLAQKVLTAGTKGYRNHPQLVRFRETGDPVGSIGAYLEGVLGEAIERGFNFNETKIIHCSWKVAIPVNQGQLEYEFRWLRMKLKMRYRNLKSVHTIKAHPLFTIRSGGIEAWEHVKQLSEQHIEGKKFNKENA